MSEDRAQVSPKRRREKLIVFLVVTSAVVVLDQVAKLWVRAHLALGESIPLIGRLSLTHVANTGSAFGLLANQTFLLTIIGITGSVAILLMLRYLSPAAVVSMVSVGLVLGGALGNLVDRIRLGHVTDFIDFRLWGSFHWPAFNVADAAITVGILLLIYWFFRLGISRRADGQGHG